MAKKSQPDCYAILNRKTWVSISICLLIFLAILTLPSPVMAEDEDDEGLIGYRPVPPETPQHDISNSTFHQLWSGPENQQFLPNVEQIDGRYINKSTNNPTNASGPELLRHETDIYFNQPPASVQTWNENDFDSLPTGDAEETVKPTPTNLKSSEKHGWIQNAFVRIFSIDPSTRLLDTEGDSSLYVGTDPTVRVFSDWEDSRPPEDTTEYISDEYRITYSDYQENHKVYRIVGEQKVPASVGYSRKMEFSHPPGNKESHPYGVRVEFEVSMYQTHEREVELEEGGTKWVTVSGPTKTYTDTLAVSHVKNVREYNPTLSAIRQPRESGSVYHVTTNEQPFAGITTPTDSYQTNWRFFTTRNPYWDNITHIYPITPVDSEVDRYSSNAHPVQTYAYPAVNATPSTVSPPNGTDATELPFESALVEYRGDVQGSTPDLNEATRPTTDVGWDRTWGIDLDTPSRDYTRINELIFAMSDRREQQVITGPEEVTVFTQSEYSLGRAGKVEFDDGDGYDEPTDAPVGEEHNLTFRIFSGERLRLTAPVTYRTPETEGKVTLVSGDIQLDGLVYNQNKITPIENISTGDYLTTTTNATVIGQTGSEMEVRVVVTTEDGNPVDTSETSGNVVIGGKNVNTNASGIATTTIGIGQYDVKYDPAPFHKAFQPKTPSSTTISPERGEFSLSYAISFATLIGFLLGLFWLPFYFVDKILGLDLWPPWQVIQSK